MTVEMQGHSGELQSLQSVSFRLVVLVAMSLGHLLTYTRT